jgi:hypothetical protein
MVNTEPDEIFDLPPVPHFKRAEATNIEWLEEVG